MKKTKKTKNNELTSEQEAIKKELDVEMTGLLCYQLEIPEEYKDPEKRKDYYSLPIRANIIFLFNQLKAIPRLCSEDLVGVTDEEKIKNITKKYMAKHEDAFIKLYKLLHREITEPIFDIKNH